jgi:hypothetical protein
LGGSPSEAGVVALTTDGYEKIAPLIALMAEVVVSESGLCFFRALDFGEFFAEVDKVLFVGNGEVEVVALEIIIHVVGLDLADGDGEVLEVDFG